jgi:hypothetical protein
LFQTAIQGGQPGLQFDGSGDALATTYGPQSGDLTAFTVWTPDLPGTTEYRRILDKNSATGFWIGKEGSGTESYGGGCRQTAAPYGTYLTLDSTKPHIVSGSRSGTQWTVRSEASSATATVSSSALDTTVLRVGMTQNLNETWKGYIFAIIYFHNLALSTSLLRRLFHAYGYSFKLACS